MRYSRVWGLALAVGLALFTWVALVWAFAEEPLPFRDPYTGQSGEEWEVKQP